MPQVKRGILFRYFDKAVLAIAVLALLAALGYAVKRGRRPVGPGQEDQARRIVDEIKKLREREPDPPKTLGFPEVAEIDPLAPDGTPEEPLPRHRFWPPIPVVYDPISVGVYRSDIVLDFRVPLNPGSVSVIQEEVEGVVQIVKHPVDRDYSRVMVSTRGVPNKPVVKAAVRGFAARVPYVQPLVVDRSIDKTPYPPIEFEVASSSEGIEIAFSPDPRVFSPDPRVVTEGVVVDYYEVVRKAWTDPLAQYVPVARIQADGTVAGGRWHPGAAVSTAERLKWMDASGKPGTWYTYRVRLVGENTYSPRPLFTEALRARAPVDQDIRLRGGRAARPSFPCSAEFDLVKVHRARGGVVRRDALSVMVSSGDEIAGTVEMFRNIVSITMGLILVDCHTYIVWPEKGRSSTRAIIADPQGNLRELWKDQMAEENKGLWKNVGEETEPDELGPEFGPEGEPGPGPGPGPGPRYEPRRRVY